MASHRNNASCFLTGENTNETVTVEGRTAPFMIDTGREVPAVSSLIRFAECAKAARSGASNDRAILAEDQQPPGFMVDRHDIGDPARLGGSLDRLFYPLI